MAKSIKFPQETVDNNNLQNDDYLMTGRLNEELPKRVSILKFKEMLKSGIIPDTWPVTFTTEDGEEFTINLLVANDKTPRVINYSNEEQYTGKMWFSQKIYQKTIYVGSLPNVGPNFADANIRNLDKVINFEYFNTRQNLSQHRNLWINRLETAGSNLIVIAERAMPDIELYVTLFYTCTDR